MEKENKSFPVQFGNPIFQLANTSLCCLNKSSPEECTTLCPAEGFLLLHSLHLQKLHLDFNPRRNLAMK